MPRMLRLVSHRMDLPQKACRPLYMSLLTQDCLTHTLACARRVDGAASWGKTRPDY